MVTKYFHSKYNDLHKDEWKEIIRNLGVNVYDVIIPCELGIVLGGFFENPNAFHDIKTVVFYKCDEFADATQSRKTNYNIWKMFDLAKYYLWVEVLDYYFDKLVDITGLKPKDAAEKIRKTVETYQS